MIKRLFAIGFIFCCVSVAWFILAGATSSRTNSADSSLKSRVAQLWGAPQAQLPPAIVAWEMVTKKVESLEDGKKIIKTVEEKLTDKLTLDSSDIKVALKLDHRQKGLLWYSTYGVDFAATYAVTNTAKVARNIEIALPFTISYLRIVFGAAFAIFAAGTAQLVYLVLFSYAFFFKGLTGLAITIGAIATLFVLMQITARVNWNAVFGERKAASVALPAAASS